MTKEAVVFILDSSPSMNAAYPSSSAAAPDDDGSVATPTSRSTRLSCAKSAVEGMLSDLMIRSKTNEAGVVVLKTRETKHYMEILEMGSSLPYANVTELSEGVTRPAVELLRKVRRVESSVSPDEDDIGGDLVDGIIVAADALYRRTHGKKYARRIVIFTDAAHKVKLNASQLLHVVEGLRAMECTLTVIGLEFSDSAEFDQPATESLSQKVSKDDERSLEEDDKSSMSQASSRENKSDDEDEQEMSEDGSDECHTLSDKREIEKLLIRLARLTGGSVIAASTMQQVLESTLGKRIPKSTRRKIELQIAPGLSVEARSSLLISQSNLPTLKKEAVMLDANLKPMRNGIGEEMMSELTTITDHWDADNSLINVGLENRTRGYKYGADCIPIGEFDLEGLKNHSGSCMKILGYTGADQIPLSLMIGPPYALSAADSFRAGEALSAVAQAMHRLENVAVCTFVKSKDADPVMGALFPLMEAESILPTGLFFMQLPFANDVQKFTMPPLDDVPRDGTHEKVCDDMIESLMLPKGALQSERLANPVIRSFRKTVVSRAVDPACEIVPAREHDSTDPMSTPRHLLEKSRACLDSFRNALPLEKESVDDDNNGRPKKRAKFWSEA